MSGGNPLKPIRNTPRAGTPTRPIRVLGIDLRTTNSTVSEIVWDPGDPRVPAARTLEVEQPTLEGNSTHTLVPSVVALLNGRVFVGEGAKRLRARSAELGLDRGRDIFYECKNDIGNSFGGVPDDQSSIFQYSRNHKHSTRCLAPRQTNRKLTEAH